MVGAGEPDAPLSDGEGLLARWPIRVPAAPGGGSSSETSGDSDGEHGRDNALMAGSGGTDPLSDEEVELGRIVALYHL